MYKSVNDLFDICLQMNLSIHMEFSCNDYGFLWITANPKTKNSNVRHNYNTNRTIIYFNINVPGSMEYIIKRLFFRQMAHSSIYIRE